MSSALDEVTQQCLNYNGFIIFKVEKIDLATCEKPGIFSSTDCYIIYHGVPKSGTTYAELYAWMGKNCDDDEYYAAYNWLKQLSKSLPNVTTIQTESQYKETSQFCQMLDSFCGMKYYGGGFKYGGKDSESAFAKADHVLYQIKGINNPTLQICPYSLSSLNQGDVFLVKTPKDLFLFEGKEANEKEIAKGKQAFQKMVAENPGLKATVIENGNAPAEFIREFSYSDATIPEASEGGDDEEVEASLPRMIYVANGENFDLVADSSKFSRSCLNSKGLFIIQSGNVVIVWVGSGLPDYCRELPTAYDTVSRFLIQHQIPRDVTISISLEGHESEQFNVIFA